MQTGVKINQKHDEEHIIKHTIKPWVQMYLNDFSVGLGTTTKK